MRNKRVVVIDVVGLSPGHFDDKESLPHLASLLDRGRLYRMKPVFPAVTLPVQASLTTGAYPQTHGIVSNGFYFPDNFHVAFWEQAAGLVREERIWDRLKKKNPQLTTAVLFFQNTLYATSDVVITPKPLHTDEGLVQWCYSKPVGFYEEVCEHVGAFNLFHFWGPMASIESSQWIANAAVETMDRLRPNLMFVYLPHLDYCSQKHGPDAAVIGDELRLVDQEVGRIVQGIGDLGLEDETVFVVLSEYIFYPVEKDIPLNRILRNKGLLEVRRIEGREYLDFELSPAFAMVDHQIAHLYIKSGHERAVRRALQETDGIDLLLEERGKDDFQINHPRSGDIVAVCSRDRWFSYYWWEDRAREPDFASRVDIHRKPGYDPLEMFLEPATMNISQDTSLIRGSHGYPAMSEQDFAALLMSGQFPRDLAVPEEPCITDIAGIIEKLLLGN